MANPAAINNNNLDAHLADPNNNNVVDNMGNNKNRNDVDIAGLVQNYRDCMTASSSSHSRPHEGAHPPQNYEPNVFQEVPVPADADTTIRALFEAINQTNYLIFSQGERLRMFEDSR